MHQPKKNGFKDNVYVILMVVGIWLIASLPVVLTMSVLSYHSHWKSVTYTPLADEIIEYAFWLGIILAILLRVFYLRKLKSGILKSWVFTFALLLCFPALLFTTTQSAMVFYTKHFGVQELLVGKVIEKYESRAPSSRSSTVYNLRTDNQKYSRIIVFKRDYHQAYIGQTVSLIQYKSQFLDFVDFDDVRFLD